ncbi:tRNA (guanosine(37)-N1)-methyltransferase TrmD [Candidatus Nomurabacteria bacterium]|nr:tRNA (guanosine(37)-N1)-methyltransferase TrmD [Candidatus Nomurabacteria bacterium]
MKFQVVTIFPELVAHYCDESILGRGQKNKSIEVHPINLRDFSDSKHKQVDDTPYGGGAGMVLQAEPLYNALKSLDAIPFSKVDGLTKVKKVFNGSLGKKKRTILMSPRGRQFDQKIARQWSKLDELTIVCGRYEGIDQRVIDHMVDEEISIGPYVLAGGELGAMTIIEAVSRLVPGVLGNAESLKDETHNSLVEEDGVESEYPQYTKPADFKGWKVPEVLLSGDHKKIQEWRQKQSKK